MMISLELLATMASLVEIEVKSYQTDFTTHDMRYLTQATCNQSAFLWSVGECGTYLIPHSDQKFDQFVIGILRNYGHYKHFWIDPSIDTITQLTLDDLLTRNFPKE